MTNLNLAYWHPLVDPCVPNANLAGIAATDDDVGLERVEHQAHHARGAVEGHSEENSR